MDGTQAGRDVTRHYQWVPKTISDAVKENYGWVQYEMGKSVTALEMLFGVLLSGPQMKGRSFFYFPDPKALDDAGNGMDFRPCSKGSAGPEGLN